MGVNDLGGQRAWMARAACRGLSVDLFFAEREDALTQGQERSAPYAEAKQVCARCLVRQECLDYALELRVPFGCFGGLALKERRRYRNQRARG